VLPAGAVEERDQIKALKRQNRLYPRLWPFGGRDRFRTCGLCRDAPV